MPARYGVSERKTRATRNFNRVAIKGWLAYKLPHHVLAAPDIDLLSKKVQTPIDTCP